MPSQQIIGPYFSGTGRDAFEHGFIVIETGGDFSYYTFDDPDGIDDDSGNTFPVAINASLQVAGYYYSGSEGMQMGFIRNADGTFINFAPAGATQTTVNGINDAGQVVGYYQDSGLTFHGFIRNSDGSITVFDAPGAGTGGGSGTIIEGWKCINTSGQVICTATNSGVGSIRNTDGSFTNYNIPNFPGEIMFAINDAGVVAGVSGGNGFTGGHGYFRATDGTITTFDPTGSVNVLLYTCSINTSGQIAGGFFDSSHIARCFIRNVDGTYVIFTPGDTTNFGGVFSYIDDAGNVCGDFFNGTDHIAHGFYRDAGSTITTFDIPSCSLLFIDGAFGTAEPLAMAPMGDDTLSLMCPLANTGTLGLGFSSTLIATGGTEPYTFAIISGSLPPGLTLDTSTGLISGTPTMVGSYPYEGQVTDAVDATATANCEIVITVAPGGCVDKSPCGTLPTLEVTRDLDATWSSESTFIITQDEPLPFTLRALVLRMSYNPD